MAATWLRTAAAGVSALVAAACGVVTNVATDGGSVGWWVALTVLVVASVGTQVWISLQQAVPPAQIGPGGVRIGRNNRGVITTRHAGGAAANGLGAVEIGRDNDGDISTNTSTTP